MDNQKTQRPESGDQESGHPLRDLFKVLIKGLLVEPSQELFGLSKYGKEMPLHRAAERRNVKRVRQLLQDGVKADTRDGHHVTPLMLAAQRGHDEIVKLLVEAGADVNAKDRASALDEGRQTPLHRACAAGRLSTAKLLLELGANPDCLSQSGWTPLYLALSSKNADLAICLLEHGANPNGSEKSCEPPLYTAAANNDLRMIKELLKRGANPNCGALSATTSVECACELMQQGADVNLKNGGDPPLLVRVTSGKLDLLKCFIEGGADVNATDKDEFTALERVAWSNPRIEVGELLIAAGADVNRLVSPGRSLLDWLSSLGRDNFYTRRQSFIEFLRSKGAKSARELNVQERKPESVGSAIQPKTKTDQATDMRDDAEFVQLWRAETNGANYGLSTEDIVAHLKAWRSMCSFRIVDAKHDMVVLEFENLPKDVDAFANDIYDFCPDVVDQGTAFAAEMQESELDGLETLKRVLQDKRKLTLWWD